MNYVGVLMSTKADQSTSIFGLFPKGVDVIEQPMSLKEVTFVGGKDMPGHRWYKLRPSFAPLLVESIYENNGNGAKTILDPYSGAGTTVLTAKAMGVESFGIELNPFLAELTSRATDWSRSPDEIDLAYHDLSKRIKAVRRKIDGLDLDQVEKKMKIERPTIHNVLRWWRPDVLASLLGLKSVLRDLDPNSIEHRVAWIALSTVCIDVANIKRLHPTLSFFDRSGELIETDRLVDEKIAVVVDDLKSVHTSKSKKATIINGDSSDISNYPKFRSPVALITSPPYANRYSYVWETRPHLYMMDLIQEAKESGDLDMRAPGGTWGVATSTLQKSKIPAKYDSIDKVLGSSLKELDDNSELMANYVRRYFNMMGDQLTTVGKALPSGSTISYVVGNSRISGQEIDTQGCLAHLMQETGLLSPTRVVVFRRRIGRRDLFEVTVMADVR
jgi:hypothetical protein